MLHEKCTSDDTAQVQANQPKRIGTTPVIFQVDNRHRVDRFVSLRTKSNVKMIRQQFERHGQERGGRLHQILFSSAIRSRKARIGVAAYQGKLGINPISHKIVGKWIMRKLQKTPDAPPPFLGGSWQRHLSRILWLLSSTNAETDGNCSTPIGDLVFVQRIHEND